MANLDTQKDNAIAKGIKDFLRFANEEKWGKKLLNDLAHAAKLVAGDEGTRGIAFMSEYYGMGGEGKTLETIGEQTGRGLTRERVRQIIDATKEKLEINVVKAGLGKTPYAKVKEIFEKAAEKNGGNYALFEEVCSHPYIKGFDNNKKGLGAILSDSNVRQVVYRGKAYLYHSKIDRRSAILAIQSKNKKERRAKTEEKMSGMSKSVTYVPLDTKQKLHDLAEKKDLPLNRLYENILTDFISFSKQTKVSSSYFPQTKSWRARQGKEEWSQIGIYIDKKIFEAAKTHATEIGVSNMSFICQAFVWATEQ